MVWRSAWTFSKELSKCELHLMMQVEGDPVGSKDLDWTPLRQASFLLEPKPYLQVVMKGLEI